ncbi:MAG: glycosyltransferase family 4 protein, partial [Proteobacteria bacterium]|nr:glycosyltransferase family 4 protein [Pseudomonadota bacterium]
MRLLLISQDFPPDVGGVQTYAYELARRLPDRCEDFAVIAPARPSDEAVDATLPCEVVRVPASANSFGFKVGPIMLKMARQRRFEVGFHVLWPTTPAAVLLRPFGGLRLNFVAAHGRELLLEPIPHRRVLHGLYNRSRAFAMHHADRLFPVSHFTRRLLRECGVPDERITVIHNGTDPAHFRPMDVQDLRDELGLDHQRVVLTVSRLVPRKGIDTVLRALPEVARHIPDVRYLIGGTGPDRDRLETLTRDLRLDEHV